MEEEQVEVTAPPIESAVDSSRRVGALEAPARRGRRSVRAHVPWWFVAPAALVYVAGFLAPNLVGAGYSFTDWDGLTSPNWIGLENFREVLSDGPGREALIHSLTLSALYLVAVNVVGLGLAIGLHRTLKTRNLLRAIVFAPAILSPLAVAYMWQFILQPDGPLNEMLRNVGLGSVAQSWLGDPTYAPWSILGVLVWQFSGIQMAIYLAGLESVPVETYEAAAVDGAGPFRMFWYITLPQLRPAMIIGISLALIGSLKIFDQVLALTGGGPGVATETLATQVYKQAFVNSKFGYSAALALVLVVIVGVLSAIQMRAMRERQG